MPVYILHGFRWPRAGFKGIRVYIIVNNVEDAAAEYLQTPESQAALLESFRQVHPDIMAALPKDGLTFIEQHDPEDVHSDNAVSQPYAYIADKVITMAMPGEPPVEPNSPEKTTGEGSAAAMKATDLSANVEDVIAEGAGLSAKGWDAFADLRDKLAPGEKIGWWIVYNGEPERPYDEFSDEGGYDEEYEEGEEDDEVSSAQETATIRPSRYPIPMPVQQPRQPQKLPTPQFQRPFQPQIQQQTQQAMQNQRQLAEVARKKAPPMPVRTKPRTTPFEEQKSPLKESASQMYLREAPSPMPEKKLPPLPPPKPQSKFPSRPKTPIKPETVRRLFGRKSST